MHKRLFIRLGEQMLRHKPTPRIAALVVTLALAVVYSAAMTGARPATAQATPSFIKTIQVLNDGIAKAWQLTSDGYALMGGRPSFASQNPILSDQLPEAKQKFMQSEQVLDQSEPTAKYPHDQFPKIYTHSDYVRASNLHGLGIIKLLEGDTSGAERHIFRSLDLAEGSFKVSLEMMSDPAWAENARSCALLLLDLHGLSAVIAGSKGNKDSQAEHERRLKELAAWMEANSR